MQMEASTKALVYDDALDAPNAGLHPVTSTCTHRLFHLSLQTSCNSQSHHFVVPWVSVMTRHKCPGLRRNRESANYLKHVIQVLARPFLFQG